jgi:predicted dehydrogenase
MTAPHGIGIVGLGVIARQYLDTLAGVPDVRIVAVADLDAARAEATAAELPGAVATTPEALYEHPGVETVLDLTIPAAHAEVRLAAIAAGRDVYGEKPLAATLPDALRIARAARAAGIRVGCAPDTVLGTGTQTARAAIDAGRIGRPIAATATMIVPGHERWHPAPDFYYRAGGGPLLDMGPYYVSALVQLLGPVVRVTGAASRLRNTRTIATGPRAGATIPVDVDTHVSGVLEHANGALSTITTSFDGAATTAAPIEVHGELASLVVPDPNGFAGDVLLRGPGDDAWTTLPPGAGFVDGSRGAGLLDFVRARGSDAVPGANGDVALHVLDVMTSLIESAHQGRRIDCTTTADRPPLVSLTAFAAWHG